MNKATLLFGVMTLSTLAAACSSAGPDLQGSNVAQAGRTPAAAPTMIVAASNDTQHEFGIHEWRMYKAASGQPGSIQGLDPSGTVVSTQTTASTSSGLSFTVTYDGRTFEQTLSGGKVVESNGDAVLQPFVAAPFADMQKTPQPDGSGTCSRDINIFGFGAVACVAGFLTSEIGIGLIAVAAGCGADAVEVGQIACDCFGTDC